MTDREAARILPYLIDRCHSEAEKAAIRKAEKALQEREERTKGCSFCTGMIYLSGDFCGSGKEDSTGHQRAMYTEDTPDFNFCPMCGRPLKGADNG